MTQEFAEAEVNIKFSVEKATPAVDESAEEDDALSFGAAVGALAVAMTALAF